MAYPGRKHFAQAAEVAEQLGLSTRVVLNSGILRPMTDDARNALVAELKRAREPHGEPMVVGPGLSIQETEDEIRILIRKKPV